MKTILSRAALAAALVLALPAVEARPYGVSSTSVGRGTAYTTARGGEAYVGPRGGAARGANGRTAVNTPRGQAYSGPNVTAASGRYGAAAVTSGGAAYATTRTGAAYATTSTAAYVARPVPPAYLRTVPAGSRTVVYQGTTCYYSAGVYYRPVFYGGATVYVVVP